MPLSSCKTVRAFSAMLDNSSGHVAESKCLKRLRLNSNPPRRVTSMEVDDPDLDAFESATRAQLRARE